MGKQTRENKESSKWRSPRGARLAIFGFLGLAAVLLVVSHFINDARSLSVTNLYEYMDDGNVAEAEFDRDADSVTIKLEGDDTPHSVDYPAGAEDTLFKDLKDADVPTIKGEGPSVFSILTALGPILLWVIIAIFALNMLTAVQQLVKSKQPATKAERPDTTLDDVKGIDEVVARAREIVDILSDPERYRKMGARVPKGMILYGPPGTGKTLLARAVAGTADVPFYKVTASRLMDKFFGASAERIANLYAEARSHGAAIVFVDEVDAIGGSRSNRTRGGADDERNAALNQLLSELDGFDKSNVFTIVATNRLDIVDEALTRAGRFDIQLFVGPPDVNGREAILKHHTRKLPLADDVNLRQFARETTGSVGADLEALANEAALTAVREGAEKISHDHFGEALATIEQGPQRKNVSVNATERRITAYHEAGHTLAALLQDAMDNPVRVTIVPRGQSGGHTRIAPEEDRQYVSKQAAKATLAWMMSGRAAEKLAPECGPDNFTSGAASDLQQATRLAENMVCQWGMGTYNTFIPLDRWRESLPYAQEVEKQVEKLLDEAETAAIELLIEHMPALEEMVTQLLADETIQGPALLRYASVTPLDGSELEDMQSKHEKVRSSVHMSALDRESGRMEVLTS